MTTMKLVSWNVNGLRACVNKGFNEYFREVDADIFCVQETKLQEGQIVLDHGEEYAGYWNYALKKDIRVRLYSLESSRYPYDMDWSRRRRTRGGSSPWNSRISIW